MENSSWIATLIDVEKTAGFILISCNCFGYKYCQDIYVVTQKCILLWYYLFEQWNSNLVIMENVSHWIYLTVWEPVTASSVLSIPHPQKPVKSFEGTRLWKVCLQAWRASGRIESFSLSCCHSMLCQVSFICTTSQSSPILWSTTCDARGRLLCGFLKAIFLWAVLDSKSKEAQGHGNSLAIILIAISERVCTRDLLQAISLHRLSQFFFFLS